MTLSALLELANFICGRYPNGQSITPARLNVLLPQVNHEYFFDRLKADDNEALQPFSKTMGDDGMPVTFSHGFGSLPTDYYAGGTGYYMHGTSAIRVNFVNDRTFEYLITHPTEHPDVAHPVGNIQSNRIRMKPNEVNHVRFTYFTRPADPVYDYCIDRDNPSRIVYMPAGSYMDSVGILKAVDGTTLTTNVESRTGTYPYTSQTVELQWPEGSQWKILYLLLIKIGVSLAEGEAEKLSQLMMSQS